MTGYQVVTLLLLIGLVFAVERWLVIKVKLAERTQVLQQHAERAAELEEFIVHFLTQKMVDDRLRQLAAEFAGAVLHQGRVLANPHDDVAIRDAAICVNVTKDAFWKANNNVSSKAKHLKVVKSIKAYLPQQSGPHTV